MTIKFIDFAPEATKKTTFIFTTTDVKSFQSAVDQSNEWVSNNDVEVINIETVVLPQIHSEEGTTDSMLTTSGEMMSNWYQFIRVWYK
ncbi:MAG: hypothetical protein COA79_12940 [Planctomycetota bacterium]|nr:MAG: hypothetical protein COA79_12940 [Planctomycetota bacterium]